MTYIKKKKLLFTNNCTYVLYVSPIVVNTEKTQSKYIFVLFRYRMGSDKLLLLFISSKEKKIVFQGIFSKVSSKVITFIIRIL